MGLYVTQGFFFPGHPAFRLGVGTHGLKGPQPDLELLKVDDLEVIDINANTLNTSQNSPLPLPLHFAGSEVLWSGFSL